MNRSAPYALAIATLCAVPVAAQEIDRGPTFRPMGFGDVSYVSTDGNRAEGFLIGQAVGHLTAALTERIHLFAELSATARASDFVLDVERLIMRYDFADFFKVSAGRYHTPHSFWNTEYHHGLWLQTTTSRPEMIRFGSLILPVHFVGIQLEGIVSPGAVGLNYSAGIGNGRSLNAARAGDAGDVNDERALVFSLSARPPAAFGLEVGAAVYLDRITREGGATPVDERITSVHLAWMPGAPELIAEYARIRHEEDAPAANPANTDAYYVQLAYRLPGGGNAIKPYVRYERTEVAADDPFFDARTLDYEATLGGVRYDFSPLAALKAEYRSERVGRGERTSVFIAQISFALTGVGTEAM